MVPARIARLDVLPRGALSGKLDRKALPVESAPAGHGPRGRMPQGEAEIAVAAAFARRFPAGAGAEQDFFTELGGNSLLAAQVVSDLRRDPRTAGLTVRDLYETRTIAGLAARLEAAPLTAPRSPAPELETHPGGVARVSPYAGLTALVQYALLASALVLGANAVWALLARGVPALVSRVGVTAFVLLLPSLMLVAALVWTAGAALLTVAAKRVLIGRYTASRHPYMGSMYLRHWIVSQLSRSLPWDLLESTGLRAVLLRALGARIGRDVHLHRGVSLQSGAWDLLTIEDGATLGRDVSLGLVTYDRQQLVFAPITIGARATLDTRARMGPGSVIEREGFLGSLAALASGGCVPAGERYDGVPAVHVGAAPGDPVSSGEAPRPGVRHTLLLLSAKALVAQVAFLPGMVIAALVLATWRSSGAALSAASLPYGAIALTVMVGYLLSLPLQAILCRVLPRVEPGAHPLKGNTALTVLLKERLVETANVALSGTLWWPTWLRAAGMKVGKRAEISTIMEATPELVTIADDCFFADGIYLGRPLLHRGHLICDRTSFQPRTFLGNHAVIPAGSHLPGGILIGVCTVADPARITSGTSWFGHPAFELPQREQVAADDSLIFRPSPLRLFNRAFWEATRLVLPVLPVATLAAWIVTLPGLRAVTSPWAFHLGVLPGAVLATGLGACLLTWAVKWTVMGRMKEAQHVLWSCWCSRWDFLFEVWSAYARPVIEAVEGTPLVAPWLRAMGARIGHNVVLGTSLAQLVDPDMLQIDDDATVSCHLQLHSFEDRVLKLGHTRFGARSTVGSGALVLYGAEIGSDVRVEEQSVVMKHEHLSPGARYIGVPTRPLTTQEG
jgi:non-ribosomal peptide synthetase-like protein